MQITGIKITGMHNIESEKYLFGSSTYFYGKNGIGKSTILQAIQWGLLGYIPGTNKTNSAIFSHSNGKQMSVEIRLFNEAENSEPDEVIIIRKLEKLSTKLEETLTIYPEGYDLSQLLKPYSLIALNFGEFLSLTANKQKELLIESLPSDESGINTYNYLETLSSDHELTNSIIEELSENTPTLDSIEDIKQLNAELKDKQSLLSAESKRIAATVQSLIFYDDYSGEQDIEYIKSEIKKYTELRDIALKNEMQAEARSKQLDELNKYSNFANSISEDLDYMNLQEVIASNSTKIADAESEKLIFEEKIRDLKYQINSLQKLIQSNGVCNYTNERCDQIADKMDSFKKQNLDKSVELQTLQEKYTNVTNTINEARLAIAQAESSIAQLKDSYSKRDNLLMLINQPEQESTYSSLELSELLKTLNDSLVKASANAKYEELSSMLQKQKLTADIQLEFVKSAIKATGENGLQSKLAEQPFKQLETSMNEALVRMNLQPMGIVKFVLAQKANSFDFGLMRNSQYIPFAQLSSGERCIFTLLFVVSLIEICDAKLKTIVIDDLFDHLDKSRFETVINYINELTQTCQIISAGVIPIDFIDTPKFNIVELR